MEFFALSTECFGQKFRARSPPGGHAERRKKPRVFLFRKPQLRASYETTTSNTIDALRDGTSFPESCGEERDIGSVLESVKWPFAEKIWPQKNLVTGKSGGVPDRGARLIWLAENREGGPDFVPPVMIAAANPL